MDGLKQSLENAIKELQEMPAAAQPPRQPVTGSSRSLPPFQASPNGLLAQASAPQAAARVAQAVLPMQTATPIQAGTQMAANSIEAALANAPSVSPHYVRPAPVPEIVPTQTPPVSVPPRQAVAKNLGAKAHLQPEKKAQIRPKVVKFDPHQKSVSPPARQTLGEVKPKPQDDSSDGLDMGNIVDFAENVVQKSKETRDKIWRWATIGISCVGGLASGWLGSGLSNQAGGLFQSGVQTIVGKAIGGGEIKLPGSLNITSDGRPLIASGSKSGKFTGKTDRAIPQDENLCTVLELDRGTGLTLAKPCKPIQIAEFNSTLGKADLLVKPQ